MGVGILLFWDLKVFWQFPYLLTAIRAKIKNRIITSDVYGKIDIIRYIEESIENRIHELCAAKL